MSTQLSQAIVRIREMILRGELAPGQRVAEAPLAELLGVSRTPVRQALPLLAQEGLLLEHETRGYVVRGFTAADIIDAIDLRAVLEGLVVRRVAEQGASKALLRELRACLTDGDAILGKRRVDESDEGAYAEMNERFHQLLLERVRAARCSPKRSSATTAFRSPRPRRWLSTKTISSRCTTCCITPTASTTRIVEALERGESARAEALMREHAQRRKREH